MFIGAHYTMGSCEFFREMSLERFLHLTEHSDWNAYAKGYAYNELVNYYAKAGCTSIALQFAHKAVKAYPDNPRYRKNLALRYYDAGNSEMALQTFKEITNKFPDNYEVYAELSRISLEMGLSNDAVYYGHKAILLGPQNENNCHVYGEACIQAARELRKSGQNQKSNELLLQAKDAFRQALLVNPYSPQTYNEIGITYLDLRKFQEAQLALRKPSNLIPQRQNTIVTLEMYLHSNRILIRHCYFITLRFQLILIMMMSYTIWHLHITVKRNMNNQ